MFIYSAIRCTRPPDLPGHMTGPACHPGDLAGTHSCPCWTSGDSASLTGNMPALNNNTRCLAPTLILAFSSKENTGSCLIISVLVTFLSPVSKAV